MTTRRSNALSKTESSRKSSAKTSSKSDLLRVIHETAAGLYQAGLMDEKTMRRFEISSLTPVKPLTPRQIARIRKKERASQAVFAHHLGVSINLISQWERGEKKPSGPSLKLLTLVEKNGLDYVA